VGGSLGRIERAILANIGADTAAEVAEDGSGKRGPVLNSGSLAYQLFAPQPHHPWNWEPSRAQVTRAMHSIVRKFPQYALSGGKGRKRLYLYKR
jgi:hypothetical protein